MKKRSNLLFAGIFIGSILICSVVLVLVLNLSKNGNEGKVKKISVEANQDMVELSSQDGNTETKTTDTSGEVENQEAIQSQQTEMQSKEPDNGLISGVENKSVELNKGIKKIAINASVDEVTVYQSNRKELEVTQIYNNIDKDDLISVDELSDTLIIATKYTDPNFQLPGNNTNRSSSLTINLPKGFQGKLEVTSDVGSIYIENELKLEELKVSSNVGDIIVKSSQNLNKAELVTDVGNVEVKGEWNVETSRVATSVGDITFHKSVKAEEFLIKVELGNISVPSEVKSNPNYSISTELGEIFIKAVKKTSRLDSILM